MFLLLNLKALKAFIKPFEVPQRSVKIKIYFNFFTLSGIGKTSLKKKNSFRNVLAHYFPFRVFFEKMDFLMIFFKLLISCCTNKITLSLSYDANLAKLGPILGKLYHLLLHYILHVY